jgi:hypothetical protein
MLPPSMTRFHSLDSDPLEKPAGWTRPGPPAPPPPPALGSRLDLQTGPCPERHPGGMTRGGPPPPGPPGPSDGPPLRPAAGGSSSSQELTIPGGKELNPGMSRAAGAWNLELGSRALLSSSDPLSLLGLLAEKFTLRRPIVGISVLARGWFLNLHWNPRPSLQPGGTTEPGGGPEEKPGPEEVNASLKALGI